MPLHTTRNDGDTLTAALYNGDHVAHNANLLAAANASRVQGLVATTTATTTIELQAAVIVLRSAGSQLPVVVTGGALVTCNIGATGPAANGRDQVAAFGAAVFLHLYFIWNGTTLASLASLNATTPTLPSGYTHWCYATTLRTVGAGALARVHANGAYVKYDLNHDVSIDGTVLNIGVATTFTTVGFSGYVPLISRKVEVNGTISFAHSTAITQHLWLRRPGTTGVGWIITSCVNQAGVTAESRTTTLLNVPSSLTYEYHLTTVPNLGGGAYLRVFGYFVPNGDT